ncbi:hypothetical protein QJS10_CPA06g00807 [Acorus calamus]|uniref:RNase H type-1 domain-containing protein n=1 Tax=Acorus calamus TaxID=4465 RepID=A0AAV9ENF8_ACOCL|nr:hypothetical protein QJS10_CPA06g00807 [Acorus calamus]
MVGGDFNEVRFSKEKVGGSKVHSRRLRSFNSCLQHSELDDLKSIGRNDLPSINLLKLKAIEVGLWIAIKAGFRSIWVETDSTTTLAWVTNRGNRSWSAIRCLQSIYLGLESIAAGQFTHIHREGNTPADILAAFQSDRGETIINTNRIWSDLHQALELDRMGTIYHRTKS